MLNYSVSQYVVIGELRIAMQLGRSVGGWSTPSAEPPLLDVAEREDDCRIRKDNAPQNFAVLRHIALNLLNQEKTLKTGIKNKRLKVCAN